MWFLRYLTAPSLRSLNIAILRRDQVALDNFVKRSPCVEALIIDERYGGDYCSYKDEVLISDLEIVDYLTSPSLRHSLRRPRSFVHQKNDTFCDLGTVGCWPAAAASVVLEADVLAAEIGRLVGGVR
ncbi:unnamed protein product [Cyclocybe aegerita]|uniref:FBD domain-containing protein n=1 Tax=Cyclocybe aegerita TaxID=1973307 RepID=A0A8S0WDD1_CYCAE|nr:unnamed protein product [Cyclocybe aegerita]